MLPNTVLLKSIRPIEFALNECIFTFNIMCGSIPPNMEAYLESVNFFLILGIKSLKRPMFNSDMRAFKFGLLLMTML